ncbi:E3 ubiquitin-protein ligase MARCH3-like isoform X1 [Pogonomyrmex barbatus]|uniref:E3 ubiquitin-protein ligase MARCH3-like isoform X1 n=1 Tax=Pogonomyrmex barbatus TaxID=144034 RepID=A0A6I9WLF8_9HYME|nr:E3 ubiquitin-protein ligase MARCH3-like isoform X1 [Pogonomyrmex barbatus]
MADQYDTIDAYEMRELSSETESIIYESDPIAFVCLYCKKDNSTGKLICPCECIGKFIHIDCLETMVNVGRVSYCMECKTAFPLEYKRKPLIEWCRNGHAELRNTLGRFCIFLIVIIGVMIYNISILVIIGLLCTFIDFSKTENIDVSIMIIFVIICDMIFVILTKYCEAKLVINNSKRLQYAYRMWRRENSDAKVIKSMRFNEITTL